MISLVNSKPCLTGKFPMYRSFVFFLFAGVFLLPNAYGAIDKKSSLSGGERAQAKKIHQQFKGAQKAENYGAALEKIRPLGLKALPGLMMVSKDRNYKGSARWVSLLEIGRLAGKKSLPFAAQLANEPDWAVRSAAIKLIGALKGSKYEDLVLKKLKDPSLMVRIHAIKTLGKIKSKEAAPVLYQKLKVLDGEKSREKSWIYPHLVEVLGDLKYQKAKPYLESLLKAKKSHPFSKEIKSALEKFKNS